METIFRLPDLGEGLTDAEVLQWHVTEGEHVTADQPLVSVETDKAVVEIPSPHAGVVARLCAAPGERVAVGEPLIEFQAGPAADRGAIVGELGGARQAATGGREQTRP
ncbi:MAG: 2-oxo acid dehydrogenase subunit E2, partial [Burkholderiales bacterium]